MKLNGTYKINDLTVVNPLIEVRQVNDNIIDKTCLIEVIFNVENALIDYSRNINGFTYEVTWEDVDIEQFILTELEKLKINIIPNTTKITSTNTLQTEELKKQNIVKRTTLITKLLLIIKKIIKWIIY